MLDPIASIQYLAVNAGIFLSIHPQYCRGIGLKQIIKVNLVCELLQGNNRYPTPVTPAFQVCEGFLCVWRASSEKFRQSLLGGFGTRVGSGVVQ